MTSKNRKGRTKKEANTRGFKNAGHKGDTGQEETGIQDTGKTQDMGKQDH